MDQAGEHRLGDHVACHGPPLLQVSSARRATFFGPSHELLSACTCGEQEGGILSLASCATLPPLPPSRGAYPDSRRPAAGGGFWRCTGRRWWGPAWPTATAPSCRLCLQTRGQINHSSITPKAHSPPPGSSACLPHLSCDMPGQAKPPDAMLGPWDIPPPPHGSPLLDHDPLCVGRSCSSSQPRGNPEWQRPAS